MKLNLDLFLPKRSPEELNTLVKDILSNQVFLSAQLRDMSMLTLVFLPLMGMEVDDADTERFKNELGVLYGYYKDALPRSINGSPVFPIVSALCRQDWLLVLEVLKREGNRDFTSWLRSSWLR